jgi:beta-lactamase class A
LRAGGRLGVFVLDTRTERSIGYRADEPFALCSTFKLPLAAFILREAERGRLTLDQRVPYTQADMVPYAPVTGPNLAQGYMTVGAMAEAAQTTSDNVAANLLLRFIGGPAGFTSIARALGDARTRLDRLEPDLNLGRPGEVRDTTTPQAMANLVAHIMTANAVLTAPMRDLLFSWMVATTTGAKRIRAGLPSAWPAGDKTGTAIADGMANKYNDVAVAFPRERGPGRSPLVIAAYYEAPGQFEEIRDQDQAVLAEVGRIAAAWADHV